MSRILLVAGASVAIYKACDLTSKLSQAGHEVATILTPHAAQLVSPQLFEALSGGPALVNEFGSERRSAMDHVDLARFPELVVVAPCSADLAGRLALGLAPDLASTTLLAVPPSLPRLLCPAMNPVMLASPAVARNLEQLARDGWELLAPTSGHVACGESGPGRLVEPETIAARIEELVG